MPTNKINISVLSGVILFLFTIGCNTKSQEHKTSSLKDESSMAQAEKRAFDIYQDSPAEAIDLFKAVATYQVEQGKSGKAGFTNLNIANIYDERLTMIDSALVYTKKALDIWMIKKDTLQMANLYKYIGLLKGKSGQFLKAQSDIQRAISLYHNVGFNEGVAVSEINLADVYLRNQQHKESILLFKSSTEFWKRQGELSRVFSNNILGVKIYREIGDDAKVEGLIKANMEIMDQVNLDNYILKSFNDAVNEMN